MDKALKQRLVGASVLIALAVIVLPMLLGGRPESGSIEPQKIEMPKQPPELSFETRRYPIGEIKQAEESEPPPADRAGHLPAPRSPVTGVVLDAATNEAVDVALDEPSVPEPVTDESVSVQEEVVDGDDSLVPEAVEEIVVEQAKAAPAIGRYIVQVASFGALDNARKLSDKLKGNGYSVLMDSVDSDVGTLHRVRVGPFDSELEAVDVMTTLESDIAGVRPRIVDLQPERAALVTTPADPLVRWVVQVGSFSSMTNADKLVASLRLNGYSTYQETISSAGSDIYRVRVGPFLRREEAISAERQLKQDMSLPGVVMSAD